MVVKGLEVRIMERGRMRFIDADCMYLVVS